MSLHVSHIILTQIQNSFLLYSLTLVTFLSPSTLTDESGRTERQKGKALPFLLSSPSLFHSFAFFLLFPSCGDLSLLGSNGPRSRKRERAHSIRTRSICAKGIYVHFFQPLTWHLSFEEEKRPYRIGSVLRYAHSHLPGVFLYSDNFIWCSAKATRYLFWLTGQDASLWLL